MNRRWPKVNCFNGRSTSFSRDAASRSRKFKIREVEFFLGVCPRGGCDRNISAEYQCVTHNRTIYERLRAVIFVVVVGQPSCLPHNFSFY